MADPITMGAFGSVAGVMAIKEILNWVVPMKYQPQYRVSKERDERLQAFQKRLQLENQEYQREMQAHNQAFQMGVEVHRMAFQEKMEMRRLQFQKQMEDQRELLQRALTEMNIRNSQEIAKFQAVAMRETQILVARENAQNMLQDHMVQNALKDFPLNISPLVLLKNRPHALSSLLRFTVAEGNNELMASETKDMCRDVLEYASNPEALNIFVAPTYVDSKIKNRKVLSDQIWDTTYQRLESFFTKHYNRRSKRPVIFYPTAWNDKFNPGMHASETLHFFLKDMPCIVIEPRFDGNNFRLMISAWGIGYTSTEHIRTEINFNINIDEILAKSVYERSKKAINVLRDLNKVDLASYARDSFHKQEDILDRNIKLYEALHIEERKAENRMDEIEAVDIYNIFNISPIQDLASLSDILSAQIGMTLACLSDIHHLKSTDAEPLLPSMMKEQFPSLYRDKDVCDYLFSNYRQLITRLREESKMMVDSNDKKGVKLLENYRNLQIDLVEHELGINKIAAKENVEEHIRQYCKYIYDFTNSDFEEVWQVCLSDMKSEDVPFFKSICKLMEQSEKKTQLTRKLERLEA